MLAVMEPPPGLEEEFNDWYDTEHIPQRCGLPGFLNARRWVCLEGFPRSLASYDLESLAALDDPAYRAVSGAQSTPWSKRLLARTARAGRMRVEVEQIWPGTARFQPAHTLARLLAARYADVPVQARDGLVAQARHAAGQATGVAQLRVFAAPAEDRSDVWLLVEFKAPATLSALTPLFGQLDGHAADFFNLYAPYDKTGP
jgi:predicted nucleotidyltransferase